MAANNEAFLEIVTGQLPSTKERVKRALDNPGVISYFEATCPEDLETHIKTLGALSAEFLLWPDELHEVSDRISHRKVLKMKENFPRPEETIQAQDYDFEEAYYDTELRLAAAKLAFSWGDSDANAQQKYLDMVAAKYPGADPWKLLAVLNSSRPPTRGAAHG